MTILHSRFTTIMTIPHIAKLPLQPTISLTEKPLFSTPRLRVSAVCRSVVPTSTELSGLRNFPACIPEEVSREEAEIYVPVYSSEEVVDKLQAKVIPERKHQHVAMYSSWVGGITTDPSLMLIPIDDHMVHRGHAVFDTTMLFNGYLYELESHLNRFLDSASQAKITSPFPRQKLRSILLQLAAASRCKTGSLRYWLSAGPGDFMLSPAGCLQSTFYAVVIRQSFPKINEGVKVITSTIPMKPSRFATMKNVNYLPNVHAKMEAEENGAFSCIWVDEQGYIAEGPNANVAFISKNRELLIPSPNNILMGCTSKRLVKLAEKLVQNGLLISVSTRDITVKEAKNSAEMMFVSSLLPILPIVEWDNQQIGHGMVGELTRAISALFWDDIASGLEQGIHAF